MTTRPTSIPVKFLLVDDLEENLLALEGLLRRDGLVLLKAKSGVEALELLLVHDVALALVDVRMPGMDGFELAELMRGTDRTRRVPIIFLTAGNADQQRRFQGYDAGAVDFLTKPIEPHVLRSKAEVFFELWLERQEVARQRDELKIATAENVRLLEETRLTAEALKDADRRKDEFLATLAHELRNPLAPIGNGLQLMRLAAEDPHAVSKARDMMERQLVHMVRLVDDLLDISRVTTGKVRLRTEPVELQSIIETAVEVSRPAIEAGLQILTVRLPNEKLRLNADPTRMSQVIGNLLTNASKYTPSGGKIEVIAEQNGDHIILRVTDSGIGIPKEMLPKVFDLFTQVGGSLDRSQGGLGIGLALVKKLVELHGGEVKAESEGQGLGCTFVVRLPLDTVGSVDGVMKPESHHLTSTRSLRILVVDDNIDGAESLSLLLTFDGHLTEMVHTGTDAVDAAFRFQPDVVFLDIGLPGLNGYEVAQALRSDERCRSTVLVALTGWGSDEDRKRSKDAGFDYHLTKPVETTQLEEMLAQIEHSRL